MAGDLTFDIELESEGETGGLLRTTKNRGDEVQRKRIVHRPGALVVQGELVETVHGTLKAGGDPATLLVFDFRVSLLLIWFLSTSGSRRHKEATIVITFADENGRREYGPDVYEVAPEGEKGYYITSKQVELKHAVNASASGGAGPASLSAGYTLERATSQSLQDQIKVIGFSQCSDDRTSGDYNQAVWILKENASQKTGVPTHLRALVLLRRERRQINTRFTATVDIRTEVDWKLGEKMKSLRGKKDTDDPINFDPRPEAQPRDLKWAIENKIDADNLESLDLEEYHNVATLERLSS